MPDRNTPTKIVIITDCIDIAFNELHQVLYNELYKLNVSNFIIDPLVPIKNFSIVNAAFSLRLLADLYPPGTIFMVVVNGTMNSPARIFGKTKNGIVIVGNNSGYFNWMIHDYGLEWLYLNNIDRNINGKSFGGKYVQAPTVAKILAGIELDKLGTKITENDLSTFSIPDGTVVHCDNFGIMKIKYQNSLDLYEQQSLKIYINSKYALDAVYSDKMKSNKDGTWVLFPGSSINSMPELVKVRSKDSAKEIDVSEGDLITWEAK